MLSTLLQALLLIVMMNSCSQETTPLSPDGGGAKPNKQARVPGECEEGYTYDYELGYCVYYGGNICAPIQNVRNTQRDKAVAQNGSNGGSLFDQIEAEQNPDAAIQNRSPAIHSYLLQIETAIRQGSQNYAASFGTCDNCEATYNSNDLLAAISNHLNPVKDAITNDGSLGNGERSILLRAIQTIYDKFDEITSLVEGRDPCFPNPSGYNANSGNPEMMTNGFFRNLVKNIKKVINIVANVVYYVGKYAIWGALLGAAVECGNPNNDLSDPCAAAGAVSGAVIGGFAGLVIGIVKTANGQYKWCVFPPCT